MRVLKFFMVMSCLISASAVGNAARAENESFDAAIVKSRPLMKDRRTPVILNLKHKGAGFPVTPPELEIYRNYPLHVFAIDPALRDFHHKMPNPMDLHGNYVFTMTPRTECGYRTWSEFDTVNTDSLQHVMADIPGAQDCMGQDIDKTETTEFKGPNYRFLLEMDTGGLRAGQQTEMKITVRDHDGVYISELQPMRGEFADMTGFYDDYQTMVRLFPEGEKPTRHTDIAGPSLTFLFTPPKDGFIRIFPRFLIENLEVQAEFGLVVLPEVSQDVSGFGDFGMGGITSRAEEMFDSLVSGREGEPELAPSEPVEEETAAAEEEEEQGPTGSAAMIQMLQAKEARRQQGQEGGGGSEGLDSLFRENANTSGDIYEDQDAKILDRGQY